MRTCTLFFLSLALLLFSPSLSAQSASGDSRTLEAILEELHKLREDLQTTSAAAQRSEILLYRVRLEMDAVDRLNQRLEQARRQVADAKNELNHFLELKKRDEAALDSVTDAAKRKELEDELAKVSNRLEQNKDNQPDAESKEAAISNDLRIEQGKLAELEDQLDRLDKQLASPRPGESRR
jgi:chromosome segregation ATPase